MVHFGLIQSRLFRFGRLSHKALNWYLFIFLLLNICVLIRELWNSLIINIMWSYQKRILVPKVTRWLLTTFLSNNSNQTTANMRTLALFCKIHPDQAEIDQFCPIISHDGFVIGQRFNYPAKFAWHGLWTDRGNDWDTVVRITDFISPWRCSTVETWSGQHLIWSSFN